MCALTVAGRQMGIGRKVVVERHCEMAKKSNEGRGFVDKARRFGQERSGRQTIIKTELTTWDH